MKGGYYWKVEEILKKYSIVNISEFGQFSSHSLTYVEQVKNFWKTWPWPHLYIYNLLKVPLYWYLWPQSPLLSWYTPHSMNPRRGNKYLHGSRSATRSHVSDIFLQQSPSLSCSYLLTVLFSPGWICDQVWHVCSAEDSVSPYASQRDPPHRWFWER